MAVYTFCPNIETENFIPIIICYTGISITVNSSAIIQMDSYIPIPVRVYAVHGVVVAVAVGAEAVVLFAEGVGGHPAAKGGVVVTGAVVAVGNAEDRHLVHLACEVVTQGDILLYDNWDYAVVDSAAGSKPS